MELSQVTLTGLGDVAMVSPYVMRATSDSRFVLSNSDAVNSPVVLDSLGSVVVGSMGRTGEGPGEYNDPALLDVVGERALISSRRNNRLIMFSLKSGLPLRTIVIREATGIGRGLLMRGDTILIAHRINDESRFGLPFHVLTPGGGIVRSFGNDDRTVDNRWTVREIRVIARNSDTTFWSANVDRYRLQLWTLSGRLLRTIMPRRDWFPTPVGQPGQINLERSPPAIISMHEDSRGNLLVLMRRSRTDWRPDTSLTSGELLLPSHAMSFVEEVLEVIDPIDGHLLASVVHRGDPILGFLGDDRLYGVHGDEGDRQVPVVWSSLKYHGGRSANE